MSSKHLVFVATINLIWLVFSAVSQEEMDMDKQAELISKKFATEFLIKKDAGKATILADVPFVEIVQGLEDKPKVIQKSADVEKRLQAVVKDFDKIGVRGKLTIEKVYHNPEGIFDLLEKIPKDVFNRKTDRVIEIDVGQRGFDFSLLTLVSWRNEKPKVIGYGLYFAR